MATKIQPPSRHHLPKYTTDIHTLTLSFIVNLDPEKTHSFKPSTQAQTRDNNFSDSFKNVFDILHSAGEQLTLVSSIHRCWH